MVLSKGNDGSRRFSGNGPGFTIRPIGSRSTAQPIAGTAVYPNQYGDGAHALLRATARGVEELEYFVSAPSRERLDYELTTTTGAKLVSSHGGLELLDGHSRAAWKMTTPVLIDARGTRHIAQVVVTADGQNRNHYSIDWSNSRVVYPAVLDPVWSAVGDLMTARTDHTATLLDDGRVLVAGGTNSSGPTSTVEIYDPLASNVDDDWLDDCAKKRSPR